MGFAGPRPRPGRSWVWLRVAVAVVVAGMVVSCGSDEETGGSTAPEPVFIEDGALTVCTSYPYPPFEFEQDGEVVGFDIDLANEVAKSLGRRPVIVNKAFPAIASGQVLNAGQCDMAIAGLTINGERARVLDFSSPYFNATQVMLVREGSGISSLSDLEDGQRIGVQSGTTGELYVTDHAPRGVEIVPFGDAGEVDAALDSGDVDAAVYDNTVVRDTIERFPEFERAEEFDTGEQYGMAVRKNSNVDLLRIINDVLADLRAGNGYDAIYERWIGEVPAGQ
jgi:polar amino acid transport system substrate-binding protein